MALGFPELTQSVLNNLGVSPVSQPSAQMIFRAPAPTKGALGAITAPTPKPIPSPGGGGGSNLSLRDQMSRGLIPWDDNLLNAGGGEADPYAQIRAEISGAWDAYINSLGDISNTYLPQQRTAQENIINTQLKQGQDTASAQKATSLRDIASTARNAFAAGNNYLGALGAGDSSAANQYSYAINKQTQKQTGELNNFVNQQLNNLQNNANTQLAQVAQWFASAQEQLKQQVAQGQLQKGQDLANLSKGILDQAISATNQIKQNSQNIYNGLVEWAANNSTNIQQLQSNIAQIPQAMGQLNTFGGTSAPIRYGGVAPTNTKYDLFGNPIQ